MKLKVFDGCTEFGSEVQAFIDRGHDVTTCGIEGNVTIKSDIRKYFPHEDEYYDFMWFSPPCTEFSIAGNRWRGSCKYNMCDMSIVEACFRLVNTCKPKYWIIENPSRGLSQKIGDPTITILYSDFGYIAKKPTDLWGKIPMKFLRYKTPTDKSKLLKNFQYMHSLPGMTMTQTRSIIPYNLGLALCIVIENEILGIPLPTSKQKDFDKYI